MLAVEFHPKFQAHYQRNNKRGGIKNLRCFPSCSPSGHVNSSFCGAPVVAEIGNLTLPSKDCLVRSWGMFAEIGSDNQMRPGMQIKLSDIEKKERRKDTPTNDWMKGEVSFNTKDPSKISVVYNRALIGWHYSWISTKHTCDAYHCFRVYVFTQERGSDVLTYVGFGASSTFQIFSRRRPKPKDSTIASSSQQGRLVSAPGPEILLERNGNNQVVGSIPTAIVGGKRRLEFPFSADPSSKRRSSTSWNFLTDGAQSLLGWFGKNDHQKQQQIMNPRPNNGLMVSAVADSNDLDEALQIRKKDMEQNLTLDRLQMMIFNFASGVDPDNMKNMAGQSSSSCSSSSLLFSEGQTDVGDLKSDDGDGIGSVFDLLGGSDLDGLVQPFFDDLFADEPDSGGAQASLQSDTAQQIVYDQSELTLGQENLKKILRNYSTKRYTEEDLNRLVANIDKLSETMTVVVRENEEFAAMIKKYISPEGMIRLKTLVASEQDGRFTWTPERELENFQPGNEDYCVEVSIFAEYRYHMRRLMRYVLTINNQTIEQYEDAMELAARHGLISPDPFYPPTTRAAAFIHLQLHSSLKDFNPLTYGDPRTRQFKDEAQQQQYAKDLLLVKRGMYRRMLCNRVLQEQRFMKLVSTTTNIEPSPPQYDITGQWILLDSALGQDPSRHTTQSRVFTILSGTSLGGFFSRMFQSMFSKLEIKVTSKTIQLQGQAMLFVRPKLVIQFEHTPTHFRAPFPISFVGATAPFLTDKEAVSWRAKDPVDGTYLINICIGGQAMHSNLKELENYTKSQVGTTAEYEVTGESHKRVWNFLDQYKGSEPLNPFHIIHKQIRIAPCRQRLTMCDTFYLFASRQHAPALTNFKQLDQIAQNPDALVLAPTSRTEFTRSYLNRNDSILDIL